MKSGDGRWTAVPERILKWGGYVRREVPENLCC